MGGGVEVPRLKNVVNNKKLNNINFLLRVPMSEVGEFLARADCLLVHLKDCPLFRITIPAKVQAYMAVGKPIVMAIAGDASNLIIESKSGVCALPSNARSIADAIKKIAYLSPNELKKMGDNGLTYYYKNMSLDSGVKNFIEVFNIAIKA